MIARKFSLAAAGAVATLLLAHGAAQAQSMGATEPYYVGGSIGAPRWDVDGTSGSNSGAGLKLFGGWAFNPNLALEAGIVDLGKLRSSSGSVRGEGVYLDAVGTWPLSGSWSLLGRAGLVHSKVSVPGDSDRGTGLKLGLGAQYQLTNNLALRGEWEHHRLSAFGDHPKVQLWSVGAKYAF